MGIQDGYKNCTVAISKNMPPFTTRSLKEARAQREEENRLAEELKREIDAIRARRIAREKARQAAARRRQAAAAIREARKSLFFKKLLRKISLAAQDGESRLLLAKSDRRFADQLKLLEYQIERETATWIIEDGESIGISHSRGESISVFHARISNYVCGEEGQILMQGLDQSLRACVNIKTNPLVYYFHKLGYNSWDVMPPAGAAFRSDIPPQRVADFLEVRGFRTEVLGDSAYNKRAELFIRFPK